jgi:hypothetical protein
VTDRDIQPIVWAILAPTSPARLEEVAAEVRPIRKGRGNRSRMQWEAIACRGEYSALINRIPGTQSTYESPMAKKLSSLLDRPVYVLYPDEDPEVAAVLVYENGQGKQRVVEDPYEFARALGCHLPGAPTLAPARTDSGGVAVVEGASAAEAARALGYDAPPEIEGYDLRITDGAVGALVSRADVSDLELTAQRLSEALPERTLYTVSTGPTRDRLFVGVVRGGKTVGIFDTHAVGSGGGGGSPRLTSIKDGTTPEEIAKALGVPLKLLGLG